MSTKSSGSPINPVCDLCYSRKVRCDRSDPCGNCQDATVTCTRRRQPTARRAKKRPTRLPRKEAPTISTASPRDPLTATIQPDEMASADSAVPDPSNVPAREPSVENYNATCQASPSSKSHATASPLPLFDAQIAIQHHLAHLQGISSSKRQILESALHVANHLPEYFGGPGKPQRGSESVTVKGTNPSSELLTWMLKDIKAARFGPFARDYFKYISETQLRGMSLVLLSKKAPTTDLILATVCVNAVCFKFLTTVVASEEDDDTDLTGGLCHTALQCRSAAQAAIKQIPMLAPPSLALLQALLAGIFLCQGSGEVSMCWDLTRAACRVCTDLGLDEIIRQRGTITEPEYYCFIWCYMLDKNYAFKLGRPKGLLDVEPGFSTHDMPLHHRHMSEYFSINVDLARIQAAILPYLGRDPRRILQETFSNFDSFGEHLIMQMQHIQTRIEKIANPSTLWEGLDARSEISALEFAYHSTMTMIFRLFQRGMMPSIDSQYLQSARQGLSALVSMCLTSPKQHAVAFLHWTLLFYPITAYFALFCNVVTTSDTGDFNLMRTIADCLGRNEMDSRPIAQVRTVLLHFVSISEKFFNDGNSALMRASAISPFAETHTSPSMVPNLSSHTAETEYEFVQSFGLGMEGFQGTSAFPSADSLFQNSTFSFLGDLDDL